MPKCFRLSLFIIAVFWVLPVHCQRIHFEEAPRWVDVVRVSKIIRKGKLFADLQKNTNDYDAIYREQQTHVRKRQVFMRSMHYLMNERERKLWSSGYAILFDPYQDSIIPHHVRIHRKHKVIDVSGHVTFTSSKDPLIIDGSEYSKQGLFTFELEKVPLKVGDVIEFAYSEIDLSKVSISRFAQTTLLTHRESGSPYRFGYYSIIHPRNKHFRSRTHVLSRRKINPRTSTERDETKLIWHWSAFSSNRPYGFLPRGGFVGTRVDVSAFRSYAEVVDWEIPFYALHPSEQPIINRYLDSLFTTPLTAEDSIRTVIRFVQDDIGYQTYYHNRGGLVPMNLQKTAQCGTGDCKSKTKLLIHLLNEMGHDAWPVAVSFANRDSSILDFPSPNHFDHIVAGFHYKGSIRYVDATVNYQGGNPFDSRTEYFGLGLPLKKGVTKPVMISSNRKSSINIKGSWKLVADSVFQKKLHLTLGDKQADAIRREMATSKKSNPEVLKSRLHKYRLVNDPNDVKDLVFADHNTLSADSFNLNFQVMHELEDVKQSQFLLFPIIGPLFGHPMPESGHTITRLNYPYDCTLSFQIELPKGYSIPELERNIQLNDPAIQFKRTTTYDDSSYQVNIRLQTFMARIDGKSRVEDIREILTQIKKALRVKIRKP